MLLIHYNRRHFYVKHSRFPFLKFTNLSSSLWAEICANFWRSARRLRGLIFPNFARIIGVVGRRLLSVARAASRSRTSMGCRTRRRRRRRVNLYVPKCNRILDLYEKWVVSHDTRCVSIFILLLSFSICFCLCWYQNQKLQDFFDRFANHIMPKNSNADWYQFGKKISTFKLK